jgi:hypothetical protein
MYGSKFIMPMNFSYVKTVMEEVEGGSHLWRIKLSSGTTVMREVEERQ